ncbi:MAG: phosphoglycolate phosphatase [Rhodobacteraceae bacterium]|nr:phosphoglycolate phosphatase [Paracoccaceae bacterium]
MEPTSARSAQPPRPPDHAPRPERARRLGVTAIVFDLDGTLVDTVPDIHACALDVLDGAGLPPVGLSQSRRFIGHGAAHFVDCLARHGRLAPGDPRRATMLARFLEIYPRATERSTLYPGVPEMLAALGQTGLRLALCTNKPEAPTRAVLAHFGLEASFAAVICGDTLPQRKPAPEPLLAALAGVGANQGLFIGDSEVDAECARAAGVPFVLCTEGYRSAEIAALPHRAAFSHHAALPHLLGSLLAPSQPFPPPAA